MAELILKAGNIDFGGPPVYNAIPNTAFKWGMAKAIFKGWDIGIISKNPLYLY